MKRFLWMLVGFLMLGAGLVFSGMSREKGTGRDKEMRHEMGEKGEHGEDVGNVKRYLNFRQELNLTDEQVKTLEKIRNDFKRDAIKRQADTKLAHMDLRGIIKQDKPDFSAAKAKIKQISELQLASKLAMIDAMEKGFNTLTSEQQNKLLQIKRGRK